MIEQQKGVFEIINNEGAICMVDTKTEGKSTFGPVWEGICESFQNGILIEAIVDRPQYRFGQESNSDQNPTGLVVKIGGAVEAFLPGSLSSKDFSDEIIGNRIAVMIESFDPLSNNIIVKEIGVNDSNFELSKLNSTIEKVGIAHIENKYVRGTIIGEHINGYHNQRTAFIVDVNGLETFLPSKYTYFPKDIKFESLIGHNIMASIQEISTEKMRIVLSMIGPYENLIKDLPKPELRKETKGIIYRATKDHIHVLLPKYNHGHIEKSLYANRSNDDWMNITGSMVSCIPYKNFEIDGECSHQFKLALS